MHGASRSYRYVWDVSPLRIQKKHLIKAWVLTHLSYKRLSAYSQDDIKTKSLSAHSQEDTMKTCKQTINWLIERAPENSSGADVYGRFYSCRLCWASKRRGL